VVRSALFGAALIVAAFAAGGIIFAFTDEGNAPASHVAALSVEGGTPPAVPTAVPGSWLGGLRTIRGAGSPTLIACGDADGDGRLSIADSPRFAGLDVPLKAGACVRDNARADFYEGGFSAAPVCDGGPSPVLLLAVASAGSDLAAPEEGESQGLLDVINRLSSWLEESGRGHAVVLAAPAVFGAAERPQTSMELWIAAYLRARLDEIPCALAVVIGHSHGGVTVTSTTAALDAEYSDRLLGVMVDRTTALYDRPASEMPKDTPLVNFFQTNEGWHGDHVEADNVVNYDESAELAPLAASDGGGGPALVSHKTLDDAPNAQDHMVLVIIEWLAS
jgi:hypothetical protein